MRLARQTFAGAGALVFVAAFGNATTATAQPFQDVTRPGAERPGDRPPFLVPEPDPEQARSRKLQEQIDALKLELQALRKSIEALQPAPLGPVKPADPPVVGKEAAEQVEPEKADASKSPTVFHLSNGFPDGGPLLIVAAAGDKVVFHDPSKGLSLPFKLSDDKKGRREVLPSANHPLLALRVAKGPAIARLAVLDRNQEPGEQGWHTVALREPVSEANPTVVPQYAVYVLGRYIYAFSAVAGRWDTLELPKGAKPTLDYDNAPSCEYDGHIYTFDINAGKWNDLDARAILESAEGGGRKKKTKE